MNDTAATVTEDDLHAYVDGMLDDAGRLRVEAWLSANAEDATLVAHWQAQNAAIRDRFAPYEASGPTDRQMIFPQSIRTRRAWPRHLARMAAAVALFVAGIAAGQFVPDLTGGQPLQLTAVEALPRQAQSAFLVYASEVRHPVEVGADQEQHLATWLGKRLNVTDLKVPNLQALGFHLVGGRLLPVNETPGAMFMYEDATGKRLTVLVGRNGQNQTTSFRFATSGAVDTFYWIDGNLGYAVTGEISRETLQQVAEQCYKQFAL